MIDNLASNQLAYQTISNINKYYQSIPTANTVDFIILYDVISNFCIKPECCVLNSSELWGMKGTVIATNCDLAEKLKAAIGPRQKIHYVWDLEWLRPYNRDYSFYKRIYQSGMPIICRSHDHAKMLRNTFNVEAAAVIENVNLDKIIEFAEVSSDR